MRRGQQSLPTIRRVETEVDKINTSGILPPGVGIERIYDRSDLIRLTTNTVLFNLVFGMILVFFVQWIFLGDLRSALIVSSTIPFALFFAMSMLVLRGESANLLSVGAIDFGLIVDATVIMVENIFRHLAEGALLNGSAETHDPSGLRGKLATIFRAATEVNRAIFFSAAIIIVGFIPLFTLSGVEGHIFSPMAKTYAYALAGALLATFTVVPALSAYLLHERVRDIPAHGTSTPAARVQSGLHAGSVVAQRLNEGPRRYAVVGAPGADDRGKMARRCPERHRA